MNASPSSLVQIGANLAVASTASKRSSLKPEVKPQSWEWTKLRKITLRQMDKFIDLFPLVLRNEDLMAVDHMRITCRRLEQILELVYAKPRPRHIKKLRRRLKLCRRTLGKLRDCDALLAVVERSIAANSPDGDAWKILQEYLKTQRQRTAQITLTKLGRVNLAIPYLRVKHDLGLNGIRKAQDPRALSKPGATGIVYERILRSLDRRWGKFAATVEKSQRDPCEHVIHAMRIAAKRLRYLTEVMSKLHIDGAEEALLWLKSLQHTVGVWHDLEIMERLLRNILSHRRFFHAERLTESHMQDLIRHNRETKKESTTRFFAMTRNSREYRDVRKWVTATLASKLQSRRPA
jgi:CHAD domain-containing protein